jgi:hypothetical protein
MGKRKEVEGCFSRRKKEEKHLLVYQVFSDEMIVRNRIEEKEQRSLACEVIGIHR